MESSEEGGTLAPRSEEEVCERQTANFLLALALIFIFIPIILSRRTL